ncbi:MAG: argininosuccinate synthase domain-containing protein [Caulobacteraceae bacterium]
MLNKINTKNGNGYQAVALYSGGTDSTVAALLAKPVVGDNILLLMIDLGCTEESIQQARKRAEILKMDFHVINGVKDFAQRFISEAIRMNGSYFGYPLGTPLGRAYMMEIALDFLDKNSNIRRYIIHGCNANQNTRFRIEKLCKSDQNIVAIGPLTTKKYTREEKCQILLNHNIPVTDGDNYAQDENIYCRALEGDVFNNLACIDENIYKITCNPIDAPNEPEVISIGFKNGIPVSLNNAEMDLDEIIIKCRELGAKHGIGRIISLEDTIPELGYKERGIYESPASVILSTAHQYLEGIILNKTERLIKADLDKKWSEIVYRGDWFGSDRKEISEFCKVFYEKTNGTVYLQLYKGSVWILNADVPNSLLIKDSHGAY